MPLRPGSWSLSEPERATSTLGWELRKPKQIVGQVQRSFAPRKGPSGGYGTVITDASEPEQVCKLNVRSSTSPKATDQPLRIVLAPPDGSWRKIWARPPYEGAARAVDAVAASRNRAARSPRTRA